jgi:BASS family bile acid:Na+ symporter
MASRTERFMYATRLIANLDTLVRRHLIWLLLSAYAAAALWPTVGLWLRSVSFGEINGPGERVKVSLPLVLLAILLGSAGLGTDSRDLRGLVRSPGALCAGMAGTLILPLLFLFVAMRTLSLWHSPAESHALVVGLALIAALPVAGSSTAWAQNVNGDVALALGLVLFSTALSPLTTPAVLQTAGCLTQGDTARTLRELAGPGTGALLLLGVAVPSLIGLLVRQGISTERAARIRPRLKQINAVVLLLLCYMNAAVALPQTVAEPDWDFLALLLLLVVVLCAGSFAAGWALGRVVGAAPGRRAALMFGLGMSNNGTGLVLASTVLAGLPRAVLPVIVYNLVQHLVAGAVAPFLDRSPRAHEDKGDGNSHPDH